MPKESRSTTHHSHHPPTAHRLPLPTSARARHYHQLDRCHRRRRPKTIIHHRPTLTSDILLSTDLSAPTPHTHQLRCAFATPIPPDRLHSARRGRQRPPGTQGIGDIGQHDPDLALRAIRRDVIDYSPCDSRGASFSTTNPRPAGEHPSVRVKIAHIPAYPRD